MSIFPCLQIHVYSLLLKGQVELRPACLFCHLINQAPIVGHIGHFRFCTVDAIAVISTPRNLSSGIQWLPLMGFYLCERSLGEQEVHALPSQQNNCSHS